jgi:O-Antigen ligase
MMMIAVGIGCSNILMSWGTIGLVVAFVLDGNYKDKFQRIYHNKRILFLCAVYGLFVLGMIYTSNINYGLHDLKIKLPLLIIPPFVFAFSPISKSEYKIIFHCLFFGGLITMVAGFLMFSGLLPLKVIDMRSYSPFISHLRVGTLLVFSIFLCVYLIVYKEYKWAPGWVYILYAICAFGFLLLLQSLTGLVALFISFIGATILGLLKKTIWKISLVLLLIGLFLSVGLAGLINREYQRIHQIEKIDFKNLPKATVHGAIYKHDTLRNETINGHYIWINICNYELDREWRKRSKLDFDGYTKNGWPLHGTLITYLSSKGLKKNAEAIQSLTDGEIKAIENGVVNYLQLNPLDIRFRINQLLVELDRYKTTNDPNQLSFATRLETWKVAVHAIKKSWLVGYGTGDVKEAMKISYVETQSKLRTENHKNPHQQYLTTILSVGVIGFIIFLIIVFSPLLEFKKQNILFLLTITISAIGMLDEDTLESQAGCTQFIFLYMITYLLNITITKNTVKKLMGN